VERTETVKIVCFGDSLTACGGEGGRFSDILQDRFPGHEFVNKGSGGDTLEDARARLERDVLSERPDVVLIEFGANDWWRDERPCEAWAADLKYCVEKIRAAGARVVVLGVFGPHRDQAGNLVPKTTGTDERGERFRRLEARIAAECGCAYVPNIQERIIGDRCSWSDANHPNEYGNRSVADTIEPILERLLGCRAHPVRKPDLFTLRDMWEEAVALGAARCAAVEGARRLTYAEADDRVRRLATGMARLAGRERPTVAVFLPNCIEYYLLYWAVVKLGGVVVPLNTWLKKESLRFIFSNVRPDLLVVRGGRDAAALDAMREASPCAVVSIAGDVEGSTAYRDLAARDPDKTFPRIDPYDVAIIMHTSGTTAEPKGAVMRHEDLRFNVMTTINAHQFSPRDVHLVVNPMFHCTALYSSLPTAAYQKSCVVITADTSPAGILRLIEKERVTTCLTTPFICRRIASLKNLHAYDTSSLRLIGYAGSPMPAATVRRLKRCFPGVDLHNFFGLTETISMTHVLTGEEADERPDSIGRLLPFVEAKIVDEENRELPPGREGRLLFARENVISEYYNAPGKLRESLCTVDGREWFDTGDLAVMDEEGYFFIKGRTKDMIIVGGENVYAAEVEAVIMEIEGVREVAVKGVPAEGGRAPLGELIKAYVVRERDSITERDVKKHCLDKLPSYKVPHFVEFLEELPRNPSGKVVKSELP